MGAVNWIPKWFHGGAAMALHVVQQFPLILSAGLAAA
jgi:hypothetical protein